MDTNEKKVKIQFPIVIDSDAKLSRLQMMLTENWYVVTSVTHKSIAMFILETEVLEKEGKRLIDYISSFHKADEELMTIKSMMPGR